MSVSFAKKLKRRGVVVGIFPDHDAVRRLFGALLAEQNDEWLAQRHNFSGTSPRRLFDPPMAEIAGAVGKLTLHNTNALMHVRRWMEHYPF
jgi:hypothetical protein